MKNFLSAIAACCAVLASPLVADEVTQEDLIAQIEAGGRNETSERRHRVEVEGCTLTTFFWKKIEGQDWVLWTSLTVPMESVDFVDFSGKGGMEYYFFDDGVPPTAVVLLKAKEGTSFTHEKPFLRTPKGKFERSPRGDGTTHYIESTNGVMIMHDGEGVRAKAEMFTKGYVRYVREYCTFTG
ncbi:hypothetical protein [Leisingera sp. ANG-M6]|uniref:hypothetical protein n=1 Tax=Leisingera sp. ANG-M6 TaxID=1577900 RepID=UPI00057CBBCA|nr:hypothetical protein [Leisingera sp. ANG-M6]KIC29102.1 hypothetical protein RA24_07955 [Leisingera sp. ANG-M6]